jgi:glycosyltransferase involved in cell wall biosynthesis
MAKRVILLTNFIPPYRLPLYRALADRVGDLQVAISTPMEANRNWTPNWEGLNVKVQKNLTLRRKWRHPHGFSEDIYVHIPYDTLSLLADYRPDAIISGEMGLRTLQAALYRRFHPESPLILWATVSEYSERGRGKLRDRLRRWLVPQADALLVNGKSGARYVRQFGIRDEQLFYAPYTTNVEPFLQVPLSRNGDRAYRLLYVGQFLERKGMIPLFSALKRYAERHSQRQLELILVGDGPLRPQLERETIPDNLTLNWIGHVDYGKLSEIYAQAGIFLFPTLADEWGLVTNEAMAAGLPVLGSLYGQSVEELVEEGKTGWTFRPDRPEELDRALERALATPPEALEQMRVSARDRIASITPERVADRMVEAIEFVSS